MYATFNYVAMDQLANQAAKLRYTTGGQVAVPVTYLMVSGAGHQGAAQHSESPHGMLMNVPGLKIAMPSGPREAKGLTRFLIALGETTGALTSLFRSGTKRFARARVTAKAAAAHGLRGSAEYDDEVRSRRLRRAHRKGSLIDLGGVTSELVSLPRHRRRGHHEPDHDRKPDDHGSHDDGNPEIPLFQFLPLVYRREPREDFQ